jgi:Peptidase S24-like
MKQVTVPGGEPPVDVPLPPVERHAGALKALVRLRDDAAAEVDGLLTIVDQQRAPILVGADVWFQNSELAGMPVLQMRGDSMGETLRDGDFVLVEAGHTDVSQGGIFAIVENDSVIITRPR